MKTFTVLFFHRSGLARLFPELSTVFGIFKLYEFLEFAFKLFSLFFPQMFVVFLYSIAFDWSESLLVRAHVNRPIEIFNSSILLKISWIATWA